MAKLKKIKIYTHHNKHFNVSFGSANKIFALPEKIISWIFYFFYICGLVVIKVTGFFKNSIIAACFHTGNIIVNFVVKTLTAAKRDILKTRETFPKRARRIFTLQFSRALLSFLVIAAIAWLGLESLRVVAKALDIKSKIMHTALIGNHYLSQAKDALSTQDLNQAQGRFALAFEAIGQGKNEVEQSGKILNNLLSLIPQKADADRLITAAGLISETGQNFILLEKNIKLLKITQTGISSTDRPTADVFQDIDYNLKNTKVKLSESADIVNKVNPNNIPSQNKAAFLDLKDKLQVANLVLNNFNEVFTLLKTLALGNKNILLLFENNNELRASGGFMGTYGEISLKDGSIGKINISSIYDLDGQLKDNIQPPSPILNLSDRWTLRDSNWFADFPTTAKIITSFYEKEGGETPDIIIAVTPNLIIDWLKITGPITLSQYGVTLNADNFIEKTQEVTTISNNLPTNSPKQILADLVPLLMQKISQMDSKSWPTVIESLQNNLNSRQIVIYSRDPDAQKQLQAFNWTGEVSQADRDYLSIVNSNLGGTKTDLYIDQAVNLTSTIGDDGTITNELEITRTNKLPKLEKTNNLDFLRVYVPLGSRLISNSGFDFKNLNFEQNKTYAVNDDVYNWEMHSLKDVLTGTIIGEESGKTFFGNWLNIDGAETKTVKLVYQLPFKINPIDHFSLLVQKQIGAQNQHFNWTFNFPKYQIVWKNFDPNELNTEAFKSDILLDKDYFLGMVLSKR